MRIAIYPGSFDPIHYGHMDIAERTAAIFDRLVIAVYARPSKSLLFSVEERVALAEVVMAPYANVQVRPYEGLTVDFACSLGAQTLVRGPRVISDFEREYQMALMNQQLGAEIETICLMTSSEYAFVSSSLVKEVFAAGGDISRMVHPVVLTAMESRQNS